MVQWSEAKARKEYQCLCCGGTVNVGEEYYRETIWKENTMFPEVNRYCKGCGQYVKQGLSFRQARIKAFGEPYLRGWRRPE